MVSECTSLPSKYLNCGQDISQCAPLFLHLPRESCFAIFSRDPLSQRERNSPVDCFLGCGCRDWAHATGDNLFVLPPFMGVPAVAFFLCCYFSLGMFRCSSPSGAVSSIAASLRTTYRSQQFFCFKSLLTHSVAAPSPYEILLRNLSRGPQGTSCPDLRVLLFGLLSGRDRFRQNALCSIQKAPANWLGLFYLCRVTIRTLQRT